MVAYGRFALQWAARTSHGQRHAQGQSHSHRREFPKVGGPGPTSVSLATTSANISLADFEGKLKILNIVSTLDTGVGAVSARRFEKERATSATWSC
jgi:peroxiredoxin